MVIADERANGRKACRLIVQCTSAYTNNFISKLIQIKRTVLTFAPVEKLERGPQGSFLAGI